jgi:hypothetical protein
MSASESMISEEQRGRGVWEESIAGINESRHPDLKSRLVWPSSLPLIRSQRVLPEEFLAD